MESHKIFVSWTTACVHTTLSKCHAKFTLLLPGFSTVLFQHTGMQHVLDSTVVLSVKGLVVDVVHCNTMEKYNYSSVELKIRCMKSSVRKCKLSH